MLFITIKISLSIMPSLLGIYYLLLVKSLIKIFILPEQAIFPQPIS